MLPDFIIAGASKTGSTWLSRCLGQHPEVFLPRETAEYFSYRYDRGQAWYESLFHRAGPVKTVGEKSTSYIIYPEVPQRMRKCVPHAKLIFVLRDPVSRAYSHYRMHLRAGLVSDRIQEVLVAGQPIVEEGRYFYQIQRFVQYFPIDQVHVFLYDQLMNDSEGFLREVYALLGVDPSFMPTLVDKKYHVTKSRPRFQKLFNATTGTVRFIVQRSTWASRAFDELRQRGAFDIFHRLNQGPPFPTLNAEHKLRLANYYADDVSALGRFLGRDLSHWLTKYRQPDPTAQLHGTSDISSVDP